jgi:SAM-dependent methyltransferase
MPLLARREVDQLGVRYAVNDVIQSELDRAPEWVHKTCFDIAGKDVPSDERGRYDLVISKMVMEHVTDAERAYKNTFDLLREGGIFLNYHPVLYSIPFVVNWLLPEQSSRRLLRLLKPHRHADDIPKFPARYSHCVVSDPTLKMIRDIGFSHVNLFAFFGHVYFEKIPVIRRLDASLNNWAMRRKHYWLASYCYALGQK